MSTKEKTETSFESAIGGRKTKELSTAFPALWDPSEAGEYIVGVYKGSEEISPKGSSGPFLSYRFQLESYKGHFTRSKQEYTPSNGELISVSGRVLAAGLENLKEGTVVGIKFLGMGEKKGKRNAPKLFEVLEIEA